MKSWNSEPNHIRYIKRGGIVTRIFRDEVKATDSAYITLRDSDSEQATNAREFTEFLWKHYAPYADQHFLDCIPNEFDERFWEMYLGCTFLDAGIEIQSYDHGPDILVELDGRRYWFEAVAPGPGQLGNPNSVPPVKPGEAYHVPGDKILLRLRNAIHEKYENKYRTYVNDGVVSPDDVYVVAINGCQIPHARADIDPPRITKAVFPIGPLQVTINRETREITDSSYAYKSNVVKANLSEVSTGIFLDEHYRNLSAVMYSTVDAGNTPSTFGKDFILVHNPNANSPLPEGFLPRGRELTATRSGEMYDISANIFS